VVYTESPKNGRAEYVASKDGIFGDGRVVVMMKPGTSASAERDSGRVALQDNDRGVIVGRRSFGKGSGAKAVPHSPTGR